MVEETKKNLDTEFTQDDFTLVQVDKKIFDQKFETKPTTFFKDAVKRFRKNKSSVIGFFILGFIALLALTVPVFNRSDINTIKREERFLQPKVFNAGSGFWDGTKKYTHLVYDTVNGTPAGYDVKSAVIELHVDEEPTLINQANKNGFGGYVFVENDLKNEEITSLTTKPMTITSDGNYTVEIKLYDEEDALDEKLAEYRVVFEVNKTTQYVVADWSRNYSTVSYNLSDVLVANSLTEATGSFKIDVKKNVPSELSYILVESIKLSCNDTCTNYEDLANISFADATEMVLRTKQIDNVDNPIYWSCNGRKGIYKSNIYYCDFTYDTYEAAYGLREVKYALSDLNKFKEAGYCTYDLSLVKYNSVTGEYDGVDAFVASYKILDEKNCPLDKLDGICQFNDITHKPTTIVGEAYLYRYYGYKKMPRYIFGTDALGQNLFKKCFFGLRQSFALALGISAFCFIFGLIWGSISGYFGGYVDLFMERFCDILGRVPDLLVISLFTLYLGSGFLTFILAIIITDWMGTAGITRTQFYRFKGREYVLASRTLGASDTRLIFKHILPNSLGTIITSSVFMITGIIRTESSFAYLHIGLDSSNSFGVILSNNQEYISSNSYLIVVPSVIMALMMISFNLFGNGLRDAMNPSLKGSE